MSQISRKAASFTESVIREMTRLAMANDAVNLAQGFPDFACPPELKEAAKAAIDADINQYAITWGARDFREAIAAKTTRFYPDWPVDPETDVTVTCGATEGMIAAMMAVLDPGDEIVVFEPWYENYGPDAILSGAIPRFVTLHEPDWHIDPDELRNAFTPRTRGIVVNSPHNPTGKVFTRAELEMIARLCDTYDVVAFTDDIYEHIVYAGEHIPLATIRAPDHRHPQSPRLPDRWRRRPAPGRRCHRAVAAGRVLHRPGRWLPRAPRRPGSSAGSRRFPNLAARRRLLRDDRHHLPDRCRRRDLRPPAR
jgi:aminotransferase